MTFTWTNAHESLARHLSLIPSEAFEAATKDKLGGSHRRVLKAWMHATYGGLCVLCETPTTLDKADMWSDNYAHLGHVISAADVSNGTHGNKGGYIAGNLSIQCRRCNMRNGHVSLRLDQIARPQDIPLEWPSLTKRAHTRVAW